MENTRRTPRYPFRAPAEVVIESGGMLLVRVKEISLHGCYLDTEMPLSAQTKVLLKIFGSHDYFEAKATVIHTHPELGMGVLFREVKPVSAAVLQKWLSDAMKGPELGQG
jgi:PilZ domain